MTEKRFTLTDERKCYFIPLIVDNQTNKKLGISKAMEYLNALHEENEQLKEELHQQEVSEQRRKEYDEFWKEKINKGLVK